MFFIIASPLLLFIVNLFSVNGDDLPSQIGVDFLVFGPNELLVKIDRSPNDFNFITLRIGVQRSNKDLEDLEYGENHFKNGNFYINDNRLQLKNGDVVHYLIAYRNRNGYRAQTGKYIFNGVYRNRNRRTISEHIRNRRHLIDQWGLNKFMRSAGPPFGHGPPWSNGPPPFDSHHHFHSHPPHHPGRGPPFGYFCNSSEESDEDSGEEFRTSTTTNKPAPPPTTTTATTTEYLPDIDIRFGS